MTVQPEPEPCTPEAAKAFGRDFEQIVTNVEQVILGKTDTIRLALTCLLAGGHLLLEDVPGTGKTSLAQAIARSVMGTHSRIQFTPDLLPADIIGSNIFNQAEQTFSFRQGPVFGEIVVADEINRASPRTQSALLQAMEENRVTVDGANHSLPDVFMIVATQNPVELAGTYLLPEAQLDRFMMRAELGYPDLDATEQILAESQIRNRSDLISPVINIAGVMDRRLIASRVYVDRAVLRYVARIADATRRHRDVSLGVSVRGSVALVRAARTWAAAQGRNYVVPNDILDLAIPTLAHRIVMTASAGFDGRHVSSVLHEVLSSVAPPATPR